jgi:ankyrin repeat protein
MFGPRVTTPNGLLCYGVNRGYEQVVRAAFQHGADPNTRCGDGDTPLMVALDSYACHLVPLLIERGGDVNARNDDGQTPLILAYNAPVTIVALLIEKGGDVNAEDDSGETPLSMARRFGHENVQLLRESGARETGTPE